LSGEGLEDEGEAREKARGGDEGRTEA